MLDAAAPTATVAANVAAPLQGGRNTRNGPAAMEVSLGFDAILGAMNPVASAPAATPATTPSVAAASAADKAASTLLPLSNIARIKNGQAASAMPVNDSPGAMLQQQARTASRYTGNSLPGYIPLPSKNAASLAPIPSPTDSSQGIASMMAMGLDRYEADKQAGLLGGENSTVP